MKTSAEPRAASTASSPGGGSFPISREGSRWVPGTRRVAPPSRLKPEMQKITFKPLKDPPDLAARLQYVLDMPESQREELRQLAMARVAERYSWEAVTDQYEELLLRL